MAAAEIVHEDAHAELVQLTQRAQRHVDVLDEQILGHFQGQSLWFETQGLQDLAHLACKTALSELTHR